MKQIKNISESQIILTDFHGVTLEANEIFDGLAFGDQDLRDSKSIHTALLNGTLSISDGINEYQGLLGIDYIRGTSSQVTRDGKPIVTTSDRPRNTYRYVTSCGDDMVLHKVGEGTRAHLDIPPGETHHIDLQFLEDIYIKDGYCNYSSTSDISWLNVYVVCPAGIPFPAPSNNGNYDNINGTWTANTNNTGKYFILPIEMKLFRFVNKMPLPSFNNFAEVEAAEPSLMPTPYILRFEVYNGNDATSNMHCHIHTGTYRATTL